LSDYPLWPFYDIEFWHLGSIIYEIIVQEVDFPTGIHFHNSGEERIRARDAFLCSALLMSPATYNGGPRAWGFFLEHIVSLRPSSGRLRLQSDVIHWDERSRAIFAERFGLGLAGWMLWSTYGVLHIADAGPFIGRMIDDPSCPYHRTGLRSLGLYGKNGGYKPDLFCLTNTEECVVAESKGAIGPPSKLTSDKRKGKEQVSNVEPYGVGLRSDAGQLVFATNLRHTGENPWPDKDSCIAVVDPDVDHDGLKVKVSPDEIVLHSYCKLLAFCGLQRLAWLLLRGVPIEMPEAFHKQPVEIGGYKILPLLRTGRHLIGLEAKVANTIFRNRENVATEISQTLIELQIDSVYSTETALLLPNGIAYSTIV
jgi:hypothetical protein